MVSRSATRSSNAIALLVVLLACFHEAYATDSVVWGRAISNEPIPGDASACGPLGENEICMAAWFVWVIDVQRTVSGPKVSGRVLTSRAQHAGVIRSYMRRNRLFVLRPIEDAGDRQRLHADYRLIDMSSPYYCLGSSPEQLGIDADDTYVFEDEQQTTHCFEVR